jgi:hypothetical protein
MKNEHELINWILSKNGVCIFTGSYKDCVNQFTTIGKNYRISLIDMINKGYKVINNN